MNSKKLIPILGLSLLLILTIGSASASEMDSNMMGDSDANIDLTATQTAVDEIDDSSIDDNVNAENIIADTGENEDIGEGIGGIDDVESEVGVKNSLGASSDSDVLASTVTFTESKYSTYFNGSGNMIPGKLKSGDTLDFSGTFTNKMFIINIPLTITSTGGTQLTDCGFRFINGASGSSVSNIKARQISVAERPIFECRDVINLTFRNNDIFSNQSGSYPMTFGNVSKVNIFNNKLQVNAFSSNPGWGQPSAMVFRNSGNCNISGNTVITNDSNGIYFTGYGGGSSMGTTPEDGSYGNYIFNNTVYSVREFPSSFCYGIQLMCKNNIVLNNTVYNTFRGISATASGNQIIGNTIHDIHGAYYSQATEELGADFAIYAVSNSLVKDNYIYNCNFKEGTDDTMAGAISAGKNSIVSGNTIKNCNGTGIKVDGNNLTVINNNLNISGYGVHIYANKADINIESNLIDSNSFKPG